MSSLFDIGADFKSLAIEKINREIKEFKGDGYGDCLPPANVRKFTREFALWLKSETKKLRKAS